MRCRHVLHITATTRTTILPSRPRTGRGWSIVSNHGYALLCLSANPDLRLWQLAAMVGVRERSIHRIVDQLAEAGYVTRVKDGGRVRYQVHREMPLGRTWLSEFTVGTLLDALADA